MGLHDGDLGGAGRQARLRLRWHGGGAGRGVGGTPLEHGVVQVVEALLCTLRPAQPLRHGLGLRRAGRAARDPGEVHLLGLLGGGLRQAQQRPAGWELGLGRGAGRLATQAGQRALLGQLQRQGRVWLMRMYLVVSRQPK